MRQPAPRPAVQVGDAAGGHESYGSWNAPSVCFGRHAVSPSRQAGVLRLRQRPDVGAVDCCPPAPNRGSAIGPSASRNDDREDDCSDGSEPQPSRPNTVDTATSRESLDDASLPQASHSLSAARRPVSNEGDRVVRHDIATAGAVRRRSSLPDPARHRTRGASSQRYLAGTHLRTLWGTPWHVPAPQSDKRMGCSMAYIASVPSRKFDAEVLAVQAPRKRNRSGQGVDQSMLRISGTAH